MLLHSNIFGEGQPFIILHGFLGMGDNWKTLGKKFSEQGFEVHLVDQRNHGRSFQDDEFNYEVLIQDLKQYCDAYLLDNIILLGHSMGGKTAMLFAAMFPEMVSKLIVADISPRYYSKHHDMILKGLSAFDFDLITTRKEAEVILTNYVQDFDARQFLLKNLYWIEKGKLGLRINLKVLVKNIEEVGKALSAHLKFEGDTLFLRGYTSDYIDAEDEVLIKKQFPKATIATVSKAGHWLHVENPREFYDDVIQFIQ